LSYDIIDIFNESLSYDKNGNIQYLVRNGGMESQTTVPVMDNLVYGYDANDKNKLLKVTDATDNTEGFKDGADNQEEYGYDPNGNMTRDDNKGISSIMYNHLNLPTKIEFNNDINTKIEYLYTAVGQKIQKKVFKYRPQITASLEPAPAVPTDYLGGFQYVYGGLQFFPTAEGYVKYTEEVRNPFDYVFNYTDHLGNIRLSYGINPDTGLLKKMEENNYYPFGLKHATYNTEEIIIVPRKKPGIPDPETARFDKFMIQKEETIIMKNRILEIDIPIEDTPITENNGYKYKYNGKELEDELGKNTYAFGWRDYDPAIGRFTKIDRFAEKYHKLTPYGYAGNNPVLINDIQGDSLWISFGRGNANRALYQDGKLLNSDGSRYEGAGVKVRKDGSVKIKDSFLSKTVAALDKASSKSAGNDLIDGIQSSTDNVNVVQSNSGNSYSPSTNTVSFDPSSTEGGLNTQGSTSRPSFIGLGHELAHSLDDISGTLNTSTIPGQNFTEAEKYATHIENQMRAEHHISLRTHYSYSMNPNTGAKTGVFPLLNSSMRSVYYPNFQYGGINSNLQLAGVVQSPAQILPSIAIIR